MLGPRQSKIVSLQVQVPASKLGGHHAIAFFQAVPEPSPIEGKQARVLFAIRLGTTLLQESADATLIQLDCAPGETTGLVRPGRISLTTCAGLNYRKDTLAAECFTLDSMRVHMAAFGC